MDPDWLHKRLITVHTKLRARIGCAYILTTAHGHKHDEHPMFSLPSTSAMGQFLISCLVRGVEGRRIPRHTGASDRCLRGKQTPRIQSPSSSSSSSSSSSPSSSPSSSSFSSVSPSSSSLSSRVASPHSSHPPNNLVGRPRKRIDKTEDINRCLGQRLHCDTCTPWLQYWLPLVEKHGVMGVHETLKHSYDFKVDTEVDEYIKTRINKNVKVKNDKAWGFFY